VGVLKARPDGSRPELVLLGLAALPILGVLIMAGGILVGTRPAHVPILGAAIVSGLLTLVPLILDQGRPAIRRHILFTMLSMSWAVFFVVPVFTRYFLLGYDPEQFTELNGVLPPDVLRGQLVALAAYLAMAAGYAAPVGAGAVAALPRPRHEWSLPTGLAVATIVIPLGWAVYLAGQFGVLPKQAGSGVLGVIAGITTYGMALLMLLYLRYRSRLVLLMLWAAIPPTMAFNFFTGSKGFTLAPLAMVPITYAAVERRFRIRWAVGALLVLSLMYPVSNFYREVVLAGFTKRAVDVLRDPLGALQSMSAYASTFDPGQYLAEGLSMTSGRFDALGITSIIARDTPSRVPYQGGWSIGYIFIAYVPRVLWPGKPLLTCGQWVTDNYGAGLIAGVRSATGPSWVGEFYFNFGMAGVIGGMFLLGVLIRMLHESVFHQDAPVPARWLGVIFIFNGVLGLGGNLLTTVNTFVFNGGFVLGIHLLARSLGGTVPLGKAERTRGVAPLSATIGG
jgi:hypothetical protein